MTRIESAARWASLLEELRRGFDDGFAAPLPPLAEPVDLLAIDVGDLRLALRMRSVTALVPGQAYVPLSGPSPGLLGLAGVRGHLVPVFSLVRLVGRETTPRLHARQLPWLALVGVAEPSLPAQPGLGATAAEPLGLAFETFAGHRRVERKDITALEAGEATWFARHLVAGEDGGPRLLLDTPAVLQSIARAAAPLGPLARNGHV